jgi:hypothetical protein
MSQYDRSRQDGVKLPLPEMERYAEPGGENIHASVHQLPILTPWVAWARRGVHPSTARPLLGLGVSI